MLYVVVVACVRCHGKWGSLVMQVRNAAQALVQDKERVATQLADAVMHQNRLASDNARLNEDIERLQGGFEEVALAMDVLNLRQQTGVCSLALHDRLFNTSLPNSQQVVTDSRQEDTQEVFGQIYCIDQVSTLG